MPTEPTNADLIDQLSERWDALDRAGVDALDGYEREAYFAWKTGNVEKLDEVLDAARADAGRLGSNPTPESEAVEHVVPDETPVDPAPTPEPVAAPEGKRRDW